MALLDTLYADEGLPPLPALAPGEQAMLDRHKVDAYTRQILQPQRRLWGVKTKPSE